MQALGRNCTPIVEDPDGAARVECSLPGGEPRAMGDIANTTGRLASAAGAVSSAGRR
jgi:hypothetical protein